MKRLMFVLVLGSLLLPPSLTTAQQSAGFSVADVNGRYAFRFQGVGSPGGAELKLVGAFTADGNGNLSDIRLFESLGTALASELVQDPNSSSFYTVDNLGFGEMQWVLCDVIAGCLIQPVAKFRFVVRDRGRTLEVIGDTPAFAEGGVGGTATLQR